MTRSLERPRERGCFKLYKFLEAHRNFLPKNKKTKKLHPLLHTFRKGPFTQATSPFLHKDIARRLWVFHPRVTYEPPRFPKLWRLYEQTSTTKTGTGETVRTHATGTTKSRSSDPSLRVVAVERQSPQHYFRFLFVNRNDKMDAYFKIK